MLYEVITLLLLLFLPFPTPIIAFNRGKQVISPRRSTDRVLWGVTSADSLEECDTLAEFVRSFEFRILAMFAVSFHPFPPFLGVSWGHCLPGSHFPFLYR